MLLELVLPNFDGGECQPRPDSRRIDDLIGSGELDKSLSLSGDLWLAIVGKNALSNERDVSNNELDVLDVAERSVCEQNLQQTSVGIYLDAYTT